VVILIDIYISIIPRHYLCRPVYGGLNEPNHQPKPRLIKIS